MMIPATMYLSVKKLTFKNMYIKEYIFVRMPIFIQFKTGKTNLWLWKSEQWLSMGNYLNGDKIISRVIMFYVIMFASIYQNSLNLIPNIYAFHSM